MELLGCDVLVVGGSIAALRAAIAAAEEGAAVVMAAKGVIGRSGCATVASSDLCGYLPDPNVDDSIERFIEDTTVAGQRIGDPRLIEVFAAEAGERIAELSRFGVRFLMSGGRLDRVQSPGHTRPRTYRAVPPPGSPAGLAVTLPLRRWAEALGVRLLEHHPVVALWRQDGWVTGAWAIRAEGEAVVGIRAGAVVLATGGGSYLYRRTNGTSDARGEGYGLALEVGASLRDMEFVQFHPTRMDEPFARMLTEGLIDDGAVLRNALGEEFMYRYHPGGSKVPRDVLCRGIFQEVRAGRGVGNYVLMDCSTIAPERLELRHRALAESLRKAGVDFPATPLRVSPAAHFFMGGVIIDVDAATGVPGFFAAGEVAGGVHGANRVGSAAFSEALVFGARAGKNAALASRPGTGTSRAAFPERPAFCRTSAGSSSPLDYKSMWSQLRTAMWEDVSVLRDANGLRRAWETIRDLASRLADAAVAPGHVVEHRSLQLALTAAAAVVRAAATRTESRGAHWREDYPAMADEWLGYVEVGLAGGSFPVGELQTSFRPQFAA